MIAKMLGVLETKPHWRHKQDETVGAKKPDQEHAQGTARKRALVCARCGFEIAQSADAIEVGGLHAYTQVNPGGFIWNFRCFSRAAGCITVGPPSSEFAWFAGYDWQLSHCRGCDLHMGWLFRSNSDEFHGLISERIVETEQDDAQ